MNRIQLVAEFACVLEALGRQGKWVLLGFLLGGLPCIAQTDYVAPSTAITSGTTLYTANSITNGSSFRVSGSASVTFTAGVYVHLEPGFQATAGTGALTFRANIDQTYLNQPIQIGGAPPVTASPSLKEYIYFRGKPVVIETSR